VTNTISGGIHDSSIVPTQTISPIDAVQGISVTIPSIPSSSPPPILSLPQKEAITLELYKTNAGCEFPCWWGIIPGETQWIEAKNFLNAISTNISTSAQSEADIEFIAEIDTPVIKKISENKSLRHFLYVYDGIVEVIHLETPREGSGVYIVSDLLNAYGRPQEVWIDTLSVSFDEFFPFRVVLYYPEKGILIKYLDDAEFADDHLIGCPQNHSGKLTLWSPQLELTFAEALNGTNALGTYGENYYKPLAEATEIDVETFYQTYLDPDTETCIKTPVELWMDR